MLFTNVCWNWFWETHVWLRMCLINHSSSAQLTHFTFKLRKDKSRLPHFTSNIKVMMVKCQGFVLSEWTVAISLASWTWPPVYIIFYFSLSSLPFSPCSGFLWTCSPCTLCQPLPEALWFWVTEGPGVRVGVWTETSYWHFESVLLREEKKRWSGVFAKSRRVGERSRVCAYNVWYNQDQERQRGRCVVGGQAMLQRWQCLCVCVCLNISVRVCRVYICLADNHMGTSSQSRFLSGQHLEAIRLH